MKKFLFLLLFVNLALYAQQPIGNVDQFIKKLSLEEKAYLVIGAGMNIPGLIETGKAPEAVVGSTQGKVPGAAGTSYILKKYDLPVVVFSDGPAGIRIDAHRKDQPGKSFYATAFPIASALASSWDVDLIKKVGHAFGNEAKAYGVDFLLAPALNIHRNPLGGRNFEYYSEDPVLSGNLAAAFVQGVQAEGVGTSIKHFAANNSETNRTALNTVVSERALREIYLKGFEIAVKKSHPWTVMSSYNKINGTYASENEDLLTGILRNEWKYEGFVMTDWFGGKDPVAQMKAGNDLLMPGTTQQAEAIIAAVKTGKLSAKILDRNIKRILNQYLKTLSYKNIQTTNQPDFEANRVLAKQASAESTILLKNEGALPIGGHAKVALFGVASYETIAGGTGSGDVNKAYMVSIEEGFRNAGLAVSERLADAYKPYIQKGKTEIPQKRFFFEPDVLVPEKSFEAAELAELANENEVAVLTLARTSGEFFDRKKEDFDLTETEHSLIKNISEAFHAQGKKLIVILNTGGVMETASWKNNTDAILLAWQGGQEAGNALAEITSGKVNPSGKLASSFPIHLNDVSSFNNFPGVITDPNVPKSPNPMAGIPSEEIYQEGIYVGYRYFDTFEVPTSFPFGFGLSFTTFEYSDLKLTQNGEEITVTFQIKNTGKTAGKEVVQLYVSAPKGRLEKPTKELKGFAKTKLLQPGESASLALTISADDLGSYDPSKSAWTRDAGDYQFLIGSDSKTIRLQTNIQLNSKLIFKTKKLLSPKIDIKELTKK
ncbi:MAG: glycoside hydrolase family 3 N-terminal domain-containing protein [Flavobacteriaceae bacterium]|nr:glycoside hydrolase family 3 N-terminal domain-containing protein [Flavobacteriaceae bacterium]MDZ4149023.1 glycoside hydrolase family 3 N-terminal domain-containing protein [Flavobacteriaceae bacterium]